jgi:hypothetical protein
VCFAKLRRPFFFVAVLNIKKATVQMQISETVLLVIRLAGALKRQFNASIHCARLFSARLNLGVTAVASRDRILLHIAF